MKKDWPSVEELIRTNPKVDSKLVASARAAIEEMRKHGFAPEGYRITGRGFSLTERQGTRSGKDALPRRHH